MFFVFILLITIHNEIFICLLVSFWLVRVFIVAWDSSLAGVSGGYSLVTVHRLLIAVDSLVVERRR